MFSLNESISTRSDLNPFALVFIPKDYNRLHFNSVYFKQKNNKYHNDIENSKLVEIDTYITEICEQDLVVGLFKFMEDDDIE